MLRAGTNGDVRNEGVLPLEVFVDAKYDGAAATIEFDDHERICPVALRARAAASPQEIVLPPHPLRRYDGMEYRSAIAEALAPLLT